MTREHLDLLGALVWSLARAVAVLYVAIRLVTYIDGLEQRGQASHDAFLKHHEKLLRDHDAATTDHRAIVQRLAR